MAERKRILPIIRRQTRSSFKDKAGTRQFALSSLPNLRFPNRSPRQTCFKARPVAMRVPNFDSGGQSPLQRDASSPQLGGCRPNHNRHYFFNVARSRAPKGSSRIRSCGDCRRMWTRPISGRGQLCGAESCSSFAPSRCRRMASTRGTYICVSAGRCSAMAS